MTAHEPSTGVTNRSSATPLRRVRHQVGKVGATTPGGPVAGPEQAECNDSVALCVQPQPQRSAQDCP